MKKSLKTTLSLLIIIGTVMGVTACGKDKAKTSPSSSEATSTTQAQAAVQSVSDLFGGSEARHCYIAADAAGVSASGDVWTDGKGQTRSLWTMSKTGDAEEIKASMVIKGTTAYVWTGDKDPIGQKMELKGDKSIEDLAKTGGIDQSTLKDMKCEGWTVDASKFELPKIEFLDLSGLGELPK